MGILCCAQSKFFDQLQKRSATYAQHQVVDQSHLLVVQKQKEKRNRPAFRFQVDFRQSHGHNQVCRPHVRRACSHAYVNIHATCPPREAVYCTSGLNMEHLMCLFSRREYCNSNRISAFIVHPSFSFSDQPLIYRTLHGFMTLTYPFSP